MCDTVIVPHDWRYGSTENMKTNNDCPEVPACAAIKHVSGIIIAGKRHHDCLQSAQAHLLNKTEFIQGFMTTKGRFLDRRAAFLVMHAAGIASADPGGYRGQELYSEDLY